MKKEVEAFADMRYGMFIHYGLYSGLGRGQCRLQKFRQILR